MFFVALFTTVSPLFQVSKLNYKNSFVKYNIYPEAKFCP